MELDKSQQQVIDHGNPDLCDNGVFAGNEERFDFQFLFDPLEEYLYLTAVFIEFSDSRSHQLEVIGKENEFLVFFFVLKGD